MRRQNRLDFRDLLGGDGARGRVAGGVASGEGSAHCGPGVFCDLAVLAAVFDGPTHAFSRDSAEKRDYAGGSPTGEWSGPAARRAVAGDPAPAPAAVAAGQLRGLRKPGSLPMECAVAIGKTPVRRWDRRRRADQGQDGEGETGVRGAQGGAGRRAPHGHNGRRCARPAGPRPLGVAFHHGIPRGGRVRRRRDIPDAARGPRVLHGRARRVPERAGQGVARAVPQHAARGRAAARPRQG